jgi:5-methylcytosine-specific restriction endonuclease McrA
VGGFRSHPFPKDGKGWGARHDFCQDRKRSDVDDLLKGVHQIESVDQTEEASLSEAQKPSSNPLAIVISLKKRTLRKPSIRLRFRFLRRDNFTCRACGRSPAKEIGVTLEADHVLAWSRGGETTFENLQTLCERCNSGKSNA